MISRLFVIFLGLALGLFTSKNAMASEPASPLSPKFSQCTSRGAITVCRYQSPAAAAMLKILYSGDLERAGYDEISVWVKLNGRSGYFRMEQSGGGWASVMLSSGALKCSFCSNEDGSGSVACPWRENVSRWLCTEAPREMKDIFYWSLDEDNELNAWDVELAFVSGQDWDSLFGQNYRFRLE